jgi:hypothetical protein
MKNKFRTLLALALSIGAIGLLLACSGSGQQSEANKLVKTANVSIEKYNSLQNEIGTLMDKIKSDPETAAGFQASKETVQQVQAKYVTSSRCRSSDWRAAVRVARWCFWTTSSCCCSTSFV